MWSEAIIFGGFMLVPACRAKIKHFKIVGQNPLSKLCFQIFSQILQTDVSQFPAGFAYQMVMSYGPVVAVRRAFYRQRMMPSLQSIFRLLYTVASTTFGSVFFNSRKICSADMCAEVSWMIAHIFLAYYVISSPLF